MVGNYIVCAALNVKHHEDAPLPLRKLHEDAIEPDPEEEQQLGRGRLVGLRIVEINFPAGFPLMRGPLAGDDHPAAGCVSDHAGLSESREGGSQPLAAPVI